MSSDKFCLSSKASNDDDDGAEGDVKNDDTMIVMSYGWW